MLFLTLHLLFPVSIWTFISLFYLEFSFSIRVSIRLFWVSIRLFRVSILFNFVFTPIAVTFWISSKFFLSIQIFRSLDDAVVITAVSDWSLKIWDSHKGKLLKTLTGHENDIFVVEPHPVNKNLILTAAHDGHIIVWDTEKECMLFKHRNMIEEQGNTQGHGPVFDAKWSKDGTTICASDSHGHVLFIGMY